jgi:hypothetical protein
VGSILCPQEGKKIKGIETSTVFSFFIHYQSKKNAFRHSIYFHRKYICLIGCIRGQKSTSTGVLPLPMQALLVTLIRLFLNYNPILVDETQVPGPQGKQANQNEQIKKPDHGALRWSGCCGTYLYVFPTTLIKGNSGRRALEKGTPSPMYRISLHGDA